ncbi:hypothetical protein [Afifella pfennigii]|uniref:hypothetical protein n=1 Tax=Afifella pfennigii TaxID=209897 RepID=UPI00047E050A|nr:hypothetical protein [Afifella pfennigii]
MPDTKAAGPRVAVDLDDDEETIAETPIDEDAPVVLAKTDDEVVDEDADLDPLDRLPAHARRNVDGSVTLPLLYPTELRTKKDGRIRERKFGELVFHRLTGADQRAIAAASEEMQSIVAFARSTRLNQAVMNALWDRLDGADIAAGGQVINNFFASGRRTGRRSSAS